MIKDTVMDKPVRLCSIEDCEAKHWGWGYCVKHFRRVQRHGDPNANHRITHNMRHTDIYGIWTGILQRCNNPKNPPYKYYGGRGIKVCDRWMKFENFYEDMGDRPTTKHSIDRIDNNGNYEPSNCKWSTAYEQTHNRRSRAEVKADLERQNTKAYKENV